MYINHAPDFIEKYGSLKPFEMEGVEQTNYIFKLVFYGASNHGCGDYTISEQVYFIRCDNILNLSLKISNQLAIKVSFLNSQLHLLLLNSTDFATFYKVIGSGYKRFDAIPQKLQEKQKSAKET